MNIIGEGFPQEIIDQVNKRQEIYGSGYATGSLRSNENILYLNANTSWCKLVSSVNVGYPPTFTSTNTTLPTSNNNPEWNRSISTPELASVGGDFRSDNYNSSNAYAKAFVLFNGVVNNDLLPQQRAGIGVNPNLLEQNNAYGIGGIDFGLRPMMGITSANIKHENRGSLRRANVKIKAWNPIQFNIIDRLYLRLGFSVLLEWGHSMYYDKDGNFQKGNSNNSLASDFLEGKGTYDNFLEKIKFRRLLTSGNYDAMFAKVSNFHWSFNKDGSYDITLDLVSVGDVVESFKINALSPTISIEDSSKENKSAKPIEDLPIKDILPLYVNNNLITQYFSKLIYENNTSLPGSPILPSSQNPKLPDIKR